MLPYQRQWLVRAFGVTAASVIEQVSRLLRLLEILALVLLIPIAFQVDLWVMFLEWLSWNKPVSAGACILAAIGSFLCLRRIQWADPVAIIQLITVEHVPPPTEVIEILIRIDPDRLKSLIYHLPISIFCLATLIAHVSGVQNRSTICLLYS